jgi:hypothetical protein
MQNHGFRVPKPLGQGLVRDPKKTSLASSTGVDPQIKPAANSVEPLQQDTSSWLTRNESADLLKMSVTTIANYERRGKLHPVFTYRPDSRGIEHRVAVYDPKELIKLPHVQAPRPGASREPGEVAARCFELFDQDKTIREAVIELRETPERVRLLHESWLDTGGADLTITAVAKEAFEKLVGPFAGVAELLSLVQDLVNRNAKT